MSASPMPSSKHTGPEQAETKETYRRARAGLISFRDGGGSLGLKQDLTFVLNGDPDRAVKLWAALCAVELHFCSNPDHTHTKHSRQ